MRRSGMLAALTLVLVAPACGSGGDSGSTATPQVVTSAAQAPPSPDASGAAVCAARGELESSVASLRGLDLGTAGAAGLVTAAQQVHQDLDALSAAASAEYRPTISALRASLAALSGTASGLTDKESVKAAMPELTAQVAAVSASWAALRRQLDNRCG
ncbi:hypothetical protein [Actinoplanes sp. NPDC049118]|uniref:hypothetical protein n=1 Tax=Actinoplanes sp. NPDC049118 TaxID=3155769 RepID=UPI0033CD05FD